MKFIGRLAGGALVALTGALILAPSPAAAAVSCSLTGTTLDVDMSAYGDSLEFSVNQSTGAVNVTNHENPVACTGSPTVNTVNLIDVDQPGAGQNGQMGIDLPPTGFGPGATPEPSGISEIEFDVDLGDGFDGVWVTGGFPEPHSDNLRFGALSGGALGGNLNAPEVGGPDGDDLRMTNVEYLNVYGGFSETVPNTIDGSGGPEFTGPFTKVINLAGGNGDDLLTGGNGSTTMNAGAGNDLLVSGVGPDNFEGAAGVDTLSYVRATGGVTFDLGSVDVFQNTGGSDVDRIFVAADIENLIGSPFGDTFTGTADANDVVPGAGSDNVSLLGGNDTFNSLDQTPDTIDCGAGNDSGIADPVGIDTVVNCESVNRPPETTIASGPADGAFTSDATPTYVLSANEPATFERRVDGGPFQSCSATCQLPQLSDGPHQVTFRATDSTGLVEQSPVTRNLIVDTVLPEVAIVSGPTGLTTNPAPTFGFTIEAGATAACGIDGAFGACSGPGDTHTASGLSDGNRSFQVRATDAAGNQAVATRSFTLAATPPEATIKKVNVRGRTATVAFRSDEPGSTFECKLDRKKFKPCTSPKRYRKLKPGKHRVQVRATDAAGNTDPTPAKKKFEIK